MCSEFRNKSASIKKIENRERRTLDPQAARTLRSRSAAHAPGNIRSAISILEAQPFSGRRVDDHIRELVMSRAATGYLALYGSISRSTLSESFE